jgi:hypothetical protein
MGKKSGVREGQILVQVVLSLDVVVFVFIGRVANFLPRNAVSGE